MLSIRTIIVVFALILFVVPVHAASVDYHAESDSISLSKSHDLADSVFAVVDKADTQDATFEYFTQSSKFRVRVIVTGIKFKDLSRVQDNLNSNTSDIVAYHGIEADTNISVR